jgi:hypothetical protein
VSVLDGPHAVEVRNRPVIGATGQSSRTQISTEYADDNHSFAAEAIARLSDDELFDDASIERLRKAPQLATLGDALILLGSARRTRFLARIKPHVW